MDFNIPPLPAIPPVSGQSAASETPIADLSYRNYDGPLHNRMIRWWTIAVAMIRLNLKPLSFKIVAALAVLPYVFIILLLFIQGRIAASGIPLSGPITNFISDTVGQKYAFQFYNALGYQLIFLLVLTLIAGAGSIASDNRNNALLIYLSKPITKSDYLLGKWMGLFLTLFMATFGPALILYLYCLFSFYSDGFLHDEPKLFLHMFVSTAAVAAVFTSIMIGISAWSKSPRIAGAILAGLYFASQTLSITLWAVTNEADPTAKTLLQHASISGVLSGLTQGIYGVTTHLIMGNRKRGIVTFDFPPPPFGIMIAVAIALCLAGIFAARVKIKAVEVISG